MAKRRMLKLMTRGAALLTRRLLACAGTVCAGTVCVGAVCVGADGSGVESAVDQTVDGATSAAAVPAVQSLVRAAAVYDEQAMRASVTRLTRIGPACLPHLRPLFRHQDANVRWQALITVGRIKISDRSFLEPLLAASKDEDADVRGEAVTVLARLFPDRPQVLMAISASQNDAHPVVRVRAYAADWELRKRRRALTALIGLLGDRDWMAVQAAARCLAHVGAPAIPGLLQVVDQADVRRRAIVIGILGQLPDLPCEVLRRLGELARSSNRSVSAAAMDALARSGRRGWLILKPLAAAPDAELRAQAVRSAALLATRDAGTLLPMLHSGLSDRDPRVRLATMATIRRLRIGDQQSVRRLCQLLQDHLPDHRGAAVAALGGLGTTARPALSQLRIVGRDDPVDYIRRHAQRIVDQLADQR